MITFLETEQVLTNKKDTVAGGAVGPVYWGSGGTDLLPPPSRPLPSGGLGVLRRGP